MVKRILTIIIILLLLLGLVFAVYLVREQTKLPGRAAQPGVLSLENSYLFASPLVAKADGREKITISAFVLSDQGLGIAGQKVELFSAPTLMATVIQQTTDSRGLAVFEITSNTPGQFNLWATVPQGKIQQTVTVTFE